MKTHHIFANNCIDYEWAMNQCESIVEQFQGTPAPSYSLSLKTPSFSKEYISYTFHRDTQQPLMKKFVDLVDRQRDRFQAEFPEQSWGYEFVNLVYVEHANRKFSWPHRDRVFFHGTWHLTIQGESNIAIFADDEDKESLLTFEPGTLWFLDSGRFLHYVAPYTQDISRFELCIMWNLAPEIERHQKERISEGPDKFVPLLPHEAHLRKSLFSHLEKKW